jgi:hypothetical protein
MAQGMGPRKAHMSLPTTKTEYVSEINRMDPQHSKSKLAKMDIGALAELYPTVKAEYDKREAEKAARERAIARDNLISKVAGAPQVWMTIHQSLPVEEAARFELLHQAVNAAAQTLMRADRTQAQLRGLKVAGKRVEALLAVARDGTATFDGIPYTMDEFIEHELKPLLRAITELRLLTVDITSDIVEAALLTDVKLMDARIRRAKGRVTPETPETV